VSLQIWKICEGCGLKAPHYELASEGKTDGALASFKVT
jgi:hypothetical protein